METKEAKKQARPSLARVKQVHLDFQRTVAEVLLGRPMLHIRISGRGCDVSLVEFCHVIWALILQAWLSHLPGESVYLMSFNKFLFCLN